MVVGGVSEMRGWNALVGGEMRGGTCGVALRSKPCVDLLRRLQPICKMRPHAPLRALCIPRQQRVQDGPVLGQ